MLESGQAEEWSGILTVGVTGAAVLAESSC